MRLLKKYLWHWTFLGGGLLSFFLKEWADVSPTRRPFSFVACMGLGILTGIVIREHWDKD